jgi:SAM-dependent methyltransferase
VKLADPGHVAEQYQDSTRFDARVRIYDLYDVSPERWIRWLFDRLALAPGERVLEIGCGTGNLWRENAGRVPAGVTLVLADLSPGMLAEARARLAGLPLAPELREADAQALPFPDESFDLVIANHMIYHVPDRARALREVRRVLRPGGRFVASTNHWTHFLELRELVTRFGVSGVVRPPNRDPDGFDLESAVEEISAVLEIARLDRRQSALEVRAAEPLLDFVRSLGHGAEIDAAALAAIRAHVERQIALAGSFHVGISAGVVHARKA